MNERLKWSAALSLLVHLLFAVTAFLILKQASYFVRPTSYTVNLVSFEAGLRQRDYGDYKETPEGIDAGFDTQTIDTEEFHRPALLTKKDKQRLSDRIAALKKGKNIEKVVRLRNIISVKGTTGNKITLEAAGEAGRKTEGSTTDIYIAEAQKILTGNWDIPAAISDKNMDAIISIKIMKDGLLQFKEFEKASGSRLFDRSVLMAITKTHRLAPPPYEMELGVRFRP